FDNLEYDDLAYALLDNATNNETQQTYGSRLERALFSYYGRVNYNIGEKYLFAGTIRKDGSSKFGSKNRFGIFPSVSAGWVISESDLFNLSFLDFFKIRASWGKNGNDKIGDFQYEALITSSNRDYYFGDDVQVIGSSPIKIPNPKIKWEESEQIDFGFDSKLFHRFSFNFDVYKKSTKNWLVIVPVRVIAGADPPTVNGGDVVNKGLEFDFGYQKVNGDFTYSIHGNVAFNKNEVTFIDNPEGVIHSERHLIFNQSDEDIYKAEVGYPIGYFSGYEMIDIFQNYDEINNYIHINEDGDTTIIQRRAQPGDIKFKDQNDDGRIDTEDKIMLGDPNPDVTYGLSFDAQYKGWDISIFMSGVAGNQIIYGYRNWTDSYANYSHELVDDRWTGEGTSNTSPRVVIGSSDNFHNMSKMFIREGSYLKIRNLNIGHDLKQSLFQNLPLQQFRIYGSISNLLTITKYPGYDPEVGYGDYDETRYENFSTGVDIGFYPQPRTYMIGLNVKF
ncbi:SusC/RagA family TonB-linked outer membrane protein, partial [Bacteroidota bacterium]